jgi:YggT family protein
MPDTGAIDFSPMVFLMILNALGYILQGAVR